MVVGVGVGVGGCCRCRLCERELCLKLRLWEGVRTIAVGNSLEERGGGHGFERELKRGQSIQLMAIA